MVFIKYITIESKIFFPILTRPNELYDRYHTQMFINMILGVVILTNPLTLQVRLITSWQ